MTAASIQTGRTGRTVRAGRHAVYVFDPAPPPAVRQATREGANGACVGYMIARGEKWHVCVPGGVREVYDRRYLAADRLAELTGVTIPPPHHKGGTTS